MSLSEHVVFPGAPFHVDLAPLDAWHPEHLARRLLIFRCASSEQRERQITSLKSGIRALLRQSPILGGNVVPLASDEDHSSSASRRTIVPGPGLELHVKDLRSQLPSLAELEKGHFAPSGLPYHLLVPYPPTVPREEPLAACKIQYSAIEGGSIVTFAGSHAVADGAGITELLRILSEATRLAQHGSEGEPTSASSNLPSGTVGSDRSLLRNITSDIPFRLEDHPAFVSASELDSYRKTKDPVAERFRATTSEVPVLLRISSEKLIQLKADAAPPDVPFISTHDAITALIWRSLLLIRSQRAGSPEDLPKSAEGQFFMPSNARRALSLPASYVGNAVYQLTAELDLATLLSPTGLQSAAGAVRRSITAVTPALVQSYSAALREQWLDWRFMTTFDTTGVAMGSGWSDTALYTYDWGAAFGRSMARLRYPGDPGIYVFPKLSNGAAEICVSVMPDEVDHLRSEECFGKYIEE